MTDEGRSEPRMRRAIKRRDFLRRTAIVSASGLLPYQHSFFIGLSIYVTDCFFGGNAKALLGDFYHPEDTKGKDAGFTTCMDF